MTKKKILICDDSPEVGRSLKSGIERIGVVGEHFEKPILAGKKELERAVKALEKRLKLARASKIDDYPDDDAAKFIDEADLLVIDYALFNLDTSVTGERIAYLARCYSKCGIIIALNQYPPYVEEYFDLTLRGHLESYAGLNIPSDSLMNSGLWEEPWSGFRPWSWPLLPQAIDKLENRVSELSEHLGDKILEYLGFKGTKALTLPRSMVEFLSRAKPEETTFQEFVDSERSGNGLRGNKERPINDEAIARIAAARIGSWLEYSVLPGQDILVDAPHLISRFPSLLGENTQDIGGWNRTASFNESLLKLDPILEPCQFKKKAWLSRPAWFWNELRDNENIEEVKNPWTIRRPDHVFCEDISKFDARDNTREFVADLNSPYSRRYVKKMQNIQYTPIVRFSM
ncbi:MAG: hypothetical protein H8D34_28180 [Chloroflexi bacterium]|nr:hypothetical protein [Chloroflexota bacterium]MBL7162973.1 hypothetical protein [Anaerolineales bacterium]